MRKAGSDDDVDVFDAMMGIEAEEFAALLDDDDDDDDDDGGSSAALCRGGVPVVRIDELTADAFRERFMERRVPVVVQDPKGEVVPMHLTPAYLRDTYGTKRVPLDVTGPDRRDVLLRDFIEQLVRAEPLEEEEGGVDDAEAGLVCEAQRRASGDRAEGSEDLRGRYMRNLQMAEWFPEEAETLRLPAIFGDNMLHDLEKVPSCPANWRKWFELFVCHPTCKGFPFLHRDTCHVYAASMQISGRKRFTMFHPDDGPFLYPVGATGSRSNVPAEIFTVTGITPDVLRSYPALAHAKRITCDVAPGEILLVPPDWWHTARAMGPDPSVSIAASFVDQAGLDQFVDAYAEFSAMQSLVKVGAGVIS